MLAQLEGFDHKATRPGYGVGAPGAPETRLATKGDKMAAAAAAAATTTAERKTTETGDADGGSGESGAVETREDENDWRYQDKVSSSSASAAVNIVPHHTIAPPHHVV